MLLDGIGAEGVEKRSDQTSGHLTVDHERAAAVVLGDGAGLRDCPFKGGPAADVRVQVLQVRG